MQAPRPAYTPVILFALDAFGVDFDPAALGQTLASARQPCRLLVSIARSVPDQVREIVEHSGLKAEWLIAPGSSRPADVCGRIAVMPPSSTYEEQMEFALALSDIVVRPESSADAPLVQRAAALGKCIVPCGTMLPPPASAIDLAPGPDPRAPGWHSSGRRLAGRLEQFLLELFAFNWRGRHHGGLKESVEKLWACCKIGWQPGAYFAPAGWEKLLPDAASRTADAPVCARFEILDRCALYGSYIHRDLAWMAHLAAAFAVFFAVAGEITRPPPELESAKHFWLFAELLTLLFIVLLIVWAQYSRLQDRWTACRLAAEQLRIARMCLPLFVLPAALRSIDNPQGPRDKHKESKDYSLLAITELKRAIRQQGLPLLPPNFTPIDAAKWVDLIVSDQMTYHHRNHRKLSLVERRLRWIKTGIFVLTIGAVLSHFLIDASWLLLFTASGPAFAAALHGAETRLGIVHRAALSEAVEGELKPINAKLKSIVELPNSATDVWGEVRDLALQAAEAMGRENTSWHGLVRREHDNIPA